MIPNDGRSFNEGGVKVRLGGRTVREGFKLMRNNIGVGGLYVGVLRK